MNNNLELKEIVFIDQTPFGCDIQTECLYNERTLGYALGVELPNPNEPPELIFKECCYTHIVLADTNSNEDLRNDYSSFFHQRQLPNETVDFVLYKFENDVEYELEDGTYGQYFNYEHFQTNPNLKGYLIEWKKVLQELGEGGYKIIKRQNIAGIDIETSSFVFTLRRYSASLANGTTRMDIIMDGFLEKNQTKFIGTGWKNSIRIKGFFGNREPQLEQDNLIDRNYKKNQISSKQTNEYKFQTGLVPDCVTDEIFDFFLLSDNIKITDYNLNNHSYNYKKYWVNYEKNEGTTYGNHTRKARLNLTFSDKVVNRINRM
ncbi:MAG TPA: hypothetical protein VFM82_09075 [Flavobacteriaceae bacterium]|nr:hypothetical protein [Flavobacteriaceae bacterium]